MGAGNTMGEVGPKLTRARRVGKTVHLVAEDLGKERVAIGAVDGPAMGAIGSNSRAATQAVGQTADPQKGRGDRDRGVGNPWGATTHRQ
jgi:hypothetical protein